MSVPTAPIITAYPLTSTNSIQFWWTSPESNGGFPVSNYRLICSSISYSINLSPAHTSYTVTNLPNSVDYTFQIAATNQLGTGPYSPFRIVQPGSAPGGVSNIGMTFINPSTANVFWTFNTNPGEATVKWFAIKAVPSTTVLGVCSTVVQSANGSERQRYIENISCTQYSIFVQAISDAGKAYETPQSVISSATFGLPSPITSITPILVSTTFIRLGWVGGAGSNSTTFRMNGSTTVPSSSAISSAIFTNLSSASNYSFIITGTAAGGSVSSSSFLLSTSFTLPSAPTVSTNSISGTAFTIQYSSFGASSYFYNIAGFSSVTASRSTTISSLTLASTYSGYVFAINNIGSSLSTNFTVLTISPPEVSTPVVLLQANNYSGSGAWLDQSGYSKNATLENGVIAKNAAGNGIVLNGATNWIFPNVITNNKWTVNVWYKNTSVATRTGVPCILTQSYISSLTADIGPMISDWGGSGGRPTNSMQVGFYISAGPQLGANIGPQLNLNTWINIQGTWDGTNIKTYVNGILFDTTRLSTGTRSNDNGGSYRIGRRWDLAYYMTGEIGEVRMYNYAITQAQVTADYTASYNTYYEPSILLRALSYSGSGAWLDQTANGNNATLDVGTIAKNAVGNGIVLDGSTNWTFPNLGLRNAWSANVWYKHISGLSSGDACIVSQITTSTAVNMVIGRISTALCTGFFNTGTWYQSANFFSYVTTNVWINIQTTWDGTNLRVYINGTLIATTQPGGTAIDSGQAYRIGRGWSPNLNYVTGEIGEVRIYKYALTQAQITSDYINSINTYYPPVLLLQASSYSGSGAWLDQSGNSKNATLENGVIAKNAAGNGIVLNGSTNWQFSNLNLGNAWTINVWYKNTGARVGTAGSVVTQNSSTGNLNLNMGYHPDNVGNFGVGFYNSTWRNGTEFSSTITANLNIWLNIQATWDGSNIKTYINGILIGTVARTGPAVDNGTAWRIGRRWDSAEYVVAEIGEVRIYNYAIIQDQVTSDYNSSYNTYNPPILLLQASSYSGSGAWLDQSGNGRNATLENGVIAKNAVGNGIVLDGSSNWTLPNIALGNAFTVNVWYKSMGSSIGGGSCIITQNGGFMQTMNFAINDTYSGGFYNGGNWRDGTTFTLTTNMWTNIQCTWDGTNMTTYINGIVFGVTQPGGTALDGGLAYRIGRRFDVAYYMVGEIGEVRIYRYAITQAQVTADYNNSVRRFAL